MTARSRSQFGSRLYRRGTAQLIDFYRQAGLRLEVSAAGTPEEIYDRTLPDLEARRLRRFAERVWAADENRRDT